MGQILLLSKYNMKTLFDKTELKSLALENLLSQSAMLEMIADDNRRMIERLLKFYGGEPMAVPRQSKGDSDRVEIDFIESRV